MKAIVLSQGNPYIKNPYLSKLSKVFVSQGMSHEFWVWNRDRAVIDAPGVREVFRFGQWGGGLLSFVGYLAWMVLLTGKVLAARGALTFFCSRLDTALPCAVVSLVRNVDYVFLDRDRLSQSYPWPKPVRAVIFRLERLVEQRAKLHVVPGLSRVELDRSGRPRANVRIVRNTPHSDVLARARSMQVLPARPEGGIRVLVSGLISPPRGSGVILDAVKRLEPARVEFIAAGRLLGAEATALAALLGDRYRGLVSNEEALGLLVASDLVLAFYDPALEINRLAEPNKWFDCAALGVPFVTNQGISTLEPFEQAGACFVCDYGNVDQLVSLLERISAKPELLEAKKVGLDSLDYIPWDEAMSQVVAESFSLPQNDVSGRK